MKPERAIEHLISLKEEALTQAVQADTPEHATWCSNVEFVIASSLGQESTVLKKFNNVSYHIGIWTGAPGEAERDAEYFKDAVGSAVAQIEAAIFQLTMLTNSDNTPIDRGRGHDHEMDGGPTVFLVHGHDGEAKHHAARVLQQLTGGDPVILHEQPSGGRTVIEKLDTYANPAIAAVILLTADDQGGVTGSKTMRPRARQNVVFELGFFIGRLGRGNVVALTKGGVEIPSDISGVVYIDMDKANWTIELGKELAHIPGLEVDIRNLKS
jgi:predicted nucleotide-binding protein